jgi:hypothetical protein
MSWFEQRIIGMVPGIRMGIVDCLDKYVMYRLGWWLELKGAQYMDGVCGKSCSNQLRTGSRE